MKLWISLFAFALLTLASFTGNAAEGSCELRTSVLSEILINSIREPANFSSTSSREARRGCCSWHGGVCGCDSRSGRLRCCDGQLSPSCGC